MADALDSKSGVRKGVWVQLPPRPFIGMPQGPRHKIGAGGWVSTEGRLCLWYDNSLFRHFYDTQN